MIPSIFSVKVTPGTANEADFSVDSPRDLRFLKRQSFPYIDHNATITLVNLSSILSNAFKTWESYLRVLNRMIKPRLA